MLRVWINRDAEALWKTRSVGWSSVGPTSVGQRIDPSFCCPTEVGPTGELAPTEVFSGGVGDDFSGTGTHREGSHERQGHRLGSEVAVDTPGIGGCVCD